MNLKNKLIFPSEYWQNKNWHAFWVMEKLGKIKT
jgi:hypothetical protein